MRVRLVAVVFLLAACQGEDSAVGGDGDDTSDEALAAGRADRNVCAPFPGGMLAGDDLLVLVNKTDEHKLASTWAPPDLVALGGSEMMPGRSGQLRGPVRDAFRALIAAARDEAQLELRARSPYRSFEDQCITFEVKVHEYGLAFARRVSAEPGRSQHQLGTTIDITSAALDWGLVQSMASRPEGRWLSQRASAFGFALAYPQGQEEVTGYAFEPWHYRYIGKAAAVELAQSGLLLETYLERCEAHDGALRCPRD